jgi:nitrite reductase/ring-hydroxylating ferredoxin subunit
VLAVGGYLGGHLTYTRGVGVDQTAFDPGPRDWSTAIDSSDLKADEPKCAVVEETPVFLLRHDDGLHALHDRCSHRGCSLARGQVEGESIVCACHGSRFSLLDGSVERGPATTSQPSFDVRESDGTIEVRRRSAS